MYRIPRKGKCLGYELNQLFKKGKCLAKEKWAKVWIVKPREHKCVRFGP